MLNVHHIYLFNGLIQRTKYASTLEINIQRTFFVSNGVHQEGVLLLVLSSLNLYQLSV